MPPRLLHGWDEPQDSRRQQITRRSSKLQEQCFRVLDSFRSSAISGPTLECWPRSLPNWRTTVLDSCGPPGWQCRHAKTIVYYLDCVKKILPSLYSTCRFEPSGLLINISYASELSIGGVFLHSFLQRLSCFEILGWQVRNSMKHLLPSSPPKLSSLSLGGAYWWRHPTRLCPRVPRSSLPREIHYSPEFYQCCRFHYCSGTNVCTFDTVTATPYLAYLQDVTTYYDNENPMHNHRQLFR